MTEEPKEIGMEVGLRRVGRLMRLNGISAVRTHKHKATTNSNHKFNIAPNLLNRTFVADRLNQKWAVNISYIWTIAQQSLLAAMRGIVVSGRSFGPVF